VVVEVLHLPLHLLPLHPHRHLLQVLQLLSLRYHRLQQLLKELLNKKLLPRLRLGQLGKQRV
jgi:hypothetical protein